MITNDKQYSISRKQRDQFRAALDSLDPLEAERRLGAKVFADAERAAIGSQIQSLDEEVNEYELLKSGARTLLKASSLDSLPLLLIQARIARGMSQRELAESLGVKEQQVQRYEADMYSSASFRRLTEIANALELNISKVAELKESDNPKEDPNGETGWDVSAFPIKEMYKRNWFADFRGSLTDAKNNAEELLVALMGPPNEMSRAFHRKKVRVDSSLDHFALLAWEARVRQQANYFDIKRTYDSKLLDDDWFNDLAKLSKYDDGPIRALEYIGNAGIIVVVEPQLPRTFLDGAAMWGKRCPIIGLTIRYDRIDNFWFVLFHELYHVKLHLKKGKLDVIFDDLDTDGDGIEREADQCAGNALVSDEVWETAFARYLQTEDSVLGLAKQLGIHKAIIAGRVRKESDNYTLLKDMIGQGEVRCQFKDIPFA